MRFTAMSRQSLMTATDSGLTVRLCGPIWPALAATREITLSKDCIAISICITPPSHGAWRISSANDEARAYGRRVCGRDQQRGSGENGKVMIDNRTRHIAVVAGFARVRISKKNVHFRLSGNPAIVGF